LHGGGVVGGVRLGPDQRGARIEPGDGRSGGGLAGPRFERAPVAPRLAPALRRALAHPRLMPYHRLAVAVAVLNLGLLWHAQARGDWRIDDGSALSALAAVPVELACAAYRDFDAEAVFVAGQKAAT
jgi:hypothetical protein